MSETETGGFSIMQNGLKVAGGSGPYEQIKREARHYAMMYGQDGPIAMRFWKHKKRLSLMPNDIAALLREIYDGLDKIIAHTTVMSTMNAAYPARAKLAYAIAQLEREPTDADRAEAFDLITRLRAHEMTRTKYQCPLDVQYGTMKAFDTIERALSRPPETDGLEGMLALIPEDYDLSLTRLHDFETGVAECEISAGPKQSFKVVFEGKGPTPAAAMQAALEKIK